MTLLIASWFKLLYRFSPRCSSLIYCICIVKCQHNLRNNFLIKRDFCNQLTLRILFQLTSIDFLYSFFNTGLQCPVDIGFSVIRSLSLHQKNPFQMIKISLFFSIRPIEFNWRSSKVDWLVSNRLKLFLFNLHFVLCEVLLS